MQIQKITTSGNAVLTSTGGSILNGDPSLNPDAIAAGQLTLVAGNGIGTAASPLLTNVMSVSAAAGAGGVHLVNNAALAIVGPSGITAAGGGIDLTVNGILTIGAPVVLNGSGNITLLALGSTDVNGAVSNKGSGNVVVQSLTGDLTLDTSGSVSAAGNIVLNAGHDFLATSRAVLSAVLKTTDGTVAITAGHAANIVQPSGALSPIPPIAGFSIQTGTGITVAAPPFLLVTPQVISPGITISIDGTATLVVTFGRSLERNFTVTINWGDGKTDVFQSMTAGTHVFTHTYSLNSIQANTIGGNSSTLGGTTLFAPVVTVRGDPRLGFFVAGQSAIISQQTVQLLSPGLGLAGTEIQQFGSRSFVRFEEPVPSVAAEAGGSAPPSGPTSFATNQSSPGGAAATASDRLLVRAVPADPSQKEDPANDLDVEEDLHINIRNLTTETLGELFAKLPDGRYRIVWHRRTAAGVATERVILDVLLRDGKPINFDDLEKPAVPVKKAGPEAAEGLLPAAPADETNDQARMEAAPPSGPAFGESHAVLPTDSGQTDVSPDAAPARDTPFQHADDGAGGDLHEYVAADVLAPAAVLVELALLRRRWKEPATPAPTDWSRAGVATRAGRLYQRLRSRSTGD
jgi:hypothetical protein